MPAGLRIVQKRRQKPVKARSGFLRCQYRSKQGGRPYRLYIPVSATDAASRPLIVMLHGCKQDAEDFAAGTRMNMLAEEMNFIVAYPEQVLDANQMKCWNWFKPEHQKRGEGEAAIIAGLARSIASRHAVDRKRIFVAGLSAGGAMAVNVATVYPDVFAAVGIHSGLPYGSACDLGSALSAMRASRWLAHAEDLAVPTIIFHGAQDETVHPENGARLLETLAGHRQASVSSQDLRTPAGQIYTRTIIHSDDGILLGEYWLVHEGKHAWSGGSALGSYTDPAGPDASREMVRFFLQQERG